MRAQDFIFWPAGTHPAKTHMAAGAVKQCLSKTTAVRLWPVSGSLILLPAQEKGHVCWSSNKRYKPVSLYHLSGLLANKNFRVITHSSSVSIVNPTQNSRWHFKYSRAVAGKLYVHYEILLPFLMSIFLMMCLQCRYGFLLPGHLSLYFPDSDTLQQMKGPTDLSSP